MLSPGSSVAYIVDTTNLKLSVQVAERDILKIKQGVEAKIDSDLYPSVTVSGKVSGISPKGDSALTVPVEIKLKNDPREPLYDGMSAKANKSLGEKNIISIPRAILVGSYQKHQVRLVRDGAVRLVDMVAGEEYGTSIEVLDGLSESDDVVANGQNNLYDGMAMHSDVLQAQLALVRAQLAVKGKRIDVEIAQADLARAIGSE